MPIFEYECTSCGKRFDKLVRSSAAATDIECPECHSREVRKQMSLFGMGSTSSFGSSAASCAPSGG